MDPGEVGAMVTPPAEAKKVGLAGHFLAKSLALPVAKIGASLLIWRYDGGGKDARTNGVWILRRGMAGAVA